MRTRWGIEDLAHQYRNGNTYVGPNSTLETPRFFSADLRVAPHTVTGKTYKRNTQGLIAGVLELLCFCRS